MNNSGWIIGVDEVGRGPLAGPVAVGVVAVPPDFAWSLLSGVNDSKQVREADRETIARAAASLRRHKKLRYTVAMVSAPVIDAIGIVPAINQAMQRGLQRVTQAKQGSEALEIEDCVVKLDGGLTAPDHYRQQETIVRGDGSEPVIGLASIVAKVKRDTYMQQLGDQPEYAGYGLGQHKGYGTVAHRAAIAQYGLSAQHRRSFCRRYAT